MTGNKVTPTTTVTPARVQLFQPTQRPKASSGKWIETGWGRCRVTGRLGQRHADVLEAILYSAERQRRTDDGAVELLVDPARVRRVLSDHGHSGERVWQWIEEIMAAIVEIETPKLKILGHLIDHVVHTKMTRPDPLRPGEGRRLWTVRLGRAMVELLANDLPLRYDPAPIARLQYGVSQAIARHVLTHSRTPAGGWRLDELIRAVGAPGRIDHRRRDAYSDAGGLAALGILVQHGRVECTQRPSNKAPNVRGGPADVSAGPNGVRGGPEMYASARCHQDNQDIQLAGDK